MRKTLVLSIQNLFTFILLLFYFLPDKTKVKFTPYNLATKSSTSLTSPSLPNIFLCNLCLQAVTLLAEVGTSTDILKGETPNFSNMQIL